MIQYGCVARYFNNYSNEVKFAMDNRFEILQIWYDKDGLGLRQDSEPLEVIRNHNFPAIIHAVLDINEFEEHVPILLRKLKYLGHKELIIHPICQSEEITSITIHKLADKVKSAYTILSRENITLYLENNSRLDPIFNTVEEIEILFRANPEVEFLLDIAHIDNYKHLEDMIRIKMPIILHVADRHLENVHEHLPIGKGNIDYKHIFTNILSKFEGKVIFEIVQSSEEIINARNKIEEYRNMKSVM